MTKKDFSVENVRTQMRKGLLEFPVLLIIAQDKVYSSDILSQLQKDDLIVVEGTLYPLLSRLKNNGLIEYQWKESKTGPPRKYYTLTKDGEDVLEELLETWRTLSSSITNLQKKYEKSR